MPGPSSPAALLALALLPALVACQSVRPEQVHLSHTGAADEVMVTWAVRSSCAATSCVGVVAYSTTNATPPATWAVSSASELTTVLTESQATPLRLYNVRLSGLAPNTTYYYLCGGAGSGAVVYAYTHSRAPGAGRRYPATLPTGLSAPFRNAYGVIADSGLVNNLALPRLLDDAAAGTLDTLLLAGDLAYDLFSSSGAVGDAYMRALEPLVATVPFHVAPGNHECVCSTEG